MRDSDIKVIGNCVILPNGKSQVFPYEIKECKVYRGMVFVLLDIPVKQLFNENIFALDEQGNIIWQIEKLTHSTADSPFTGIHIEKGGNLLLNNWSGITYTVVPETGKILDTSLTK